MNRPPDDLDKICMQWAEKTRPLLNLADAGNPGGDDALSALQAAASAIIQVNPKRDTGVAIALNALTFEQRQLTQLHFLLPEVPVRLKAKFAGVPPQLYYTMLGTAKEFLRGHMAAAMVDARMPPMARRIGTVTLPRKQLEKV